MRTRKGSQKRPDLFERLKTGPEGPARALLRVTAADPEAVAAVLAN
jgi:hypothetical protein